MKFAAYMAWILLHKTVNLVYKNLLQLWFPKGLFLLAHLIHVVQQACE